MYRGFGYGGGMGRGWGRGRGFGGGRGFGRGCVLGWGVQPMAYAPQAVMTKVNLQEEIVALREEKRIIDDEIAEIEKMLK